MDQVKYLLDDHETPTHWYNIVADLPERPPRPLDPRTHQPMQADQLHSLTAMELLRQDGSSERWIEIPDDVRRAYLKWRPSPMYRARDLERHLKTPARIYYKYEGVSPTGSHKANSAIAQAYFNRAEGITRLTTETGAGQWGTALAQACAMLGVKCEVFWAGASYDQKPYRRVLMELLGAAVHRSPSSLTKVGRREYDRDPTADGSIGLAVSEAVEVALADPAVGYALGSTAGHVILHQTVIGQEALAQMRLAEDYPDMVISCVGGGSSLGGIGFPFLGRNLSGEAPVELVAAEPDACPTLTRGRYAWDHGDQEGLTPLMKMYTLGHTFVPKAIHAGGLRYHGVSPLVSYARHKGWVTPRAKSQRECFEAGELFARVEGIVAAPESLHALAVMVEEAKRSAATGRPRTLLVLVTGHGHFDLAAYAQHVDGSLVDAVLTDRELDAFLAELPEVHR